MLKWSTKNDASLLTVNSNKKRRPLSAIFGGEIDYSILSDLEASNGKLTSGISTGNIMREENNDTLSVDMPKPRIIRRNSLRGVRGAPDRHGLLKDCKILRNGSFPKKRNGGKPSLVARTVSHPTFLTPEIRLDDHDDSYLHENALNVEELVVTSPSKNVCYYRQSSSFSSHNSENNSLDSCGSVNSDDNFDTDSGFHDDLDLLKSPNANSLHNTPSPNNVDLITGHENNNQPSDKKCNLNSTSDEVNNTSENSENEAINFKELCSKIEKLEILESNPMYVMRI